MRPVFNRRSVRCTNLAATGESGAAQTIELNQDKPIPIIASGWSRAEKVSGQPDGNYAIYLDIAYNDGTFLYGQVAPFDVGTHDWQYREVTVKPAKPIKSLTYYVLFRHKSSSVWFDDVSLRVLEEPSVPREVLANGGFEQESRQGRPVEVPPGGKLAVPPYSGRVYLYAAPTSDELAKPGVQLTVKTKPGLGEVRFRVDGFDYWTRSGSWTTEYVLGPQFGTFSITFDEPGRHVIEVVDVVPADMKTPAGYGSGERLDRLFAFESPRN